MRRSRSSSMRGARVTKPEALPMSMVMIKCPTTGRSVSTAIETESSVFHRLPKVASRMLCPACGQEHVWMMGSAWLADEPRLVTQGRPNETAVA